MSILKAHTPAFKIKAPKKELVWFEKSAHSACFEEAEKFNRLMVDMVLSTKFIVSGRQG